MDKELIERLRVMADEIASRGCPGWADTMREAADELARIDAERGKEAVAWFLNSSPAGTAPFYEQVAKQYEGDTDTFPLFLSPTIPEGMVLVPIEQQKNAARYEWLRNSSVGPSQIWELLSDDCNPPIMTLKSMGDLDSAIDSARLK